MSRALLGKPRTSVQFPIRSTLFCVFKSNYTNSVFGYNVPYKTDLTSTLRIRPFSIFVYCQIEGELSKLTNTGCFQFFKLNSRCSIFLNTGKLHIRRYISRKVYNAFGYSEFGFLVMKCFSSQQLAIINIDCMTVPLALGDISCSNLTHSVMKLSHKDAKKLFSFEFQLRLVLFSSQCFSEKRATGSRRLKQWLLMTSELTDFYMLSSSIFISYYLAAT